MITINEKSYRELRCNKCRKFFIYEYIFAGRLAIQCERCGLMNEFEMKHFNTKENTDIIRKEFALEGGEQNG